MMLIKTIKHVQAQLLSSFQVNKWIKVYLVELKNYKVKKHILTDQVPLILVL